jgi:hypothetical protein
MTGLACKSLKESLALGERAVRILVTACIIDDSQMGQSLNRSDGILAN